MKPEINIALMNAAQEILTRFSPLIEDEYEHYRDHNKIDIAYFDEDTDEEKTWKIDALKKFIQHWVE